MRPILAGLIALVLWTAPAFAVQPEEMLADPALEARAQALGKELRCLVCQSESIEDSNADLASDLRVLVREKIMEGLSDREIKDFLVERYGTYVLLNPPKSGSTLWLWLAPGILVAVGGVFVVMVLRRKAARVDAPVADLTPAEKARLAALAEAEDGTAKRDGAD